MNTSDLERALHTRAEQAGPPPADLLGRIAGLRRARRRRRTAVLATAAAVLVVAVAVPATLALTDDRGGSTAGPVEVPVLGVATRGSLADDAALVEAVAELPWPAASADGSDGSVLDTAPGSRHVEFVGDVEGTRYALVTGTVTGDRYAAWFTAPVGGRAPEFLPSGYPQLVTPDRPLAYADTTVASPVVLVVAAPGDDVDFSDRAVLTAAGTLDRSYSPGQDLDDGVAALPTDEGRVGGVSFRVSRDSVTVWRSGPDTFGGSRPAPDVDTSLRAADPRGTGLEVTVQQLQDTFAEITTALQLPLDQLQPTVLWAGPVPGPENRDTRALVVGVTAPSGGSIVSAVVFTDVGDGQYGITIGGWETYDSDHPLLEQAQLFRSTVSDGSATGRPVSALLLLDPVDGGTPSPPVGSTQLAPGVHLLPADSTTAVAVLDASTGEELSEARLMDSGYFDRYDYGTGPA